MKILLNYTSWPHYFILKDERLAQYLEVQNIDLVMPFTKRLVDKGIFEKDSKWFRHELVQKCFEDDLSKEEKEGIIIELRKQL